MTALEANPWNPNSMDAREFNLLVENIKLVGFVEPIVAVPLGDDRYRIISGEHRWKAAQVLGLPTVPVEVVDAELFDEDTQKFQTLRLQVIRGKLSPERFMSLYDELSERYAEPLLADMMGFADREVVEKFKKAVARQLPTGMREKFKKATKDLLRIDDISAVLNKIFREHGNDLQQGFLVFSYGKQEHVYVEMTPELKAKVDAWVSVSRETKVPLPQIILHDTGDPLGS